MFIHANHRQPYVSAPLKTATTRPALTFQGSDSESGNAIDSCSEDMDAFIRIKQQQRKKWKTPADFRDELSATHQRDKDQYPESNPEPAYLSTSEEEDTPSATPSKKALRKLIKSKTPSEGPGSKDRRVSLTGSDKGPNFLHKYLQQQKSSPNLEPWLTQEKDPVPYPGPHEELTNLKDLQIKSTDDVNLTFPDEHEPLPAGSQDKQPDPLNLFNLDTHTLKPFWKQ